MGLNRRPWSISPGMFKDVQRDILRKEQKDVWKGTGQFSCLGLLGILSWSLCKRRDPARNYIKKQKHEASNTATGSPLITDDSRRLQ